MVVTVQKEVARRIAAKPGSKDYSSFSVLCSSVYKITLLQVINSSSFYPVPRVDSQGVRLDLIPYRDKLPELFYPLVRSLFSNRRKTLRNTLSQFAASVIIKYPGNDSPEIREVVTKVLNRTGISGDWRAEILGINEFSALAASLEEIATHGY
jgi:16S rRNA (adenine1518-N6/adenine1519-N6)-dimethyltransferase